MPNVNSEKDLCRCCHAEGSYKNLYESHSWLDVEEAVYSKLIQECYSIEMAPITTSLQHTLCSICDSCIERLRDAVQFRRQVVKCEKRFRDVYGGCVGEGTTDNAEIKIKEEPEMKEDEFVVEVDPNGAHTSLRLNHGPALDDDDDDDNDHDDDGFGRDDDDDDHFVKKEEKGPDKSVKVKKEETASDSEDELPLTQVKSAKKRKAPAKKAPAKKRTRNNDDSGLAKDIEGLEVIQGVKLIRVKTPTAKKGVDYTESGDTQQCLRCPKTFIKRKRSSCMINHVNMVHFKVTKYQCPDCLELFQYLNQLVKHKYEKHGIDERIRCNPCGKTFFKKRAYKNHLDQFHMLGKKIKCTECDYETYLKSNYEKHFYKHTDEKKFQCQYCKKRFKRRITMVMHEKIHTGDKRKICTVCGQAFVQRASLKYHMNRHHPGVEF